MSKAISTYKAFLMHSTDGSSYSKLVDIKDYPDLGGAPEMLDKTTLSESRRSYIPGIQETDAFEFTANYNSGDYETVKALEGTTHYYAVWLGATVADGVVTPDGSDGKFPFTGQVSVYVEGGAVNEVIDMHITIAPETIDF